jgi:hypothetical protein
MRMESAQDLFSDFDFHPDEQYVRQFRVPAAGVLRLDENVFVSEAESDGIVLRHYAFADEWFKVNVTIDRAGEVVEPELSPPAIVKSVAYNCDIATPMLSVLRASLDSLPAVQPGRRPTW